MVVRLVPGGGVVDVFRIAAGHLASRPTSMDSLVRARAVRGSTEQRAVGGGRDALFTAGRPTVMPQIDRRLGLQGSHPGGAQVERHI